MVELGGDRERGREGLIEGWMGGNKGVREGMREGVREGVREGKIGREESLGRWLTGFKGDVAIYNG